MMLKPHGNSTVNERLLEIMIMSRWEQKQKTVRRAMTRVNDACKIPYRTVYLCFHLALNKQDRDTGTRYYLFLTFTIVIKTEQGMISVLFLNTMSDRRSIIDHGECRVFRSSRFSSNGSLSPRKINVSTNVVTYVQTGFASDTPDG